MKTIKKIKIGIGILLVVLAGIVYASPNLLFSRDKANEMAQSAGWLPHQQISLGLDKIFMEV